MQPERMKPATKSPAQSRQPPNASPGKTAENGTLWQRKQLFYPRLPRQKPQCKNRTQSGNLPNHANPVIKVITVQTTPHPVYPVHPCKLKIGAATHVPLPTPQPGQLHQAQARPRTPRRPRPPRRRRLLPPLERSRCPQEAPARPFPSPQETSSSTPSNPETSPPPTAT